MKPRFQKYEIFLRIGSLVISAIFVAIGIDWCMVPNNITIGGASGVAQIINAIFPQMPIGVLNILINIPLLIAGYRLLGKNVFGASLLAMLLQSLMIDFLSSIHKFQPMEPLVAALFGGVLVGISVGIVLRQDATTGGVDLAAKLLKLKIEWLPIGQLVTLVNLMIVLGMAFIFQNIMSILYGIIAIYVVGITTDTVVCMGDHATLAYIISEKPDEIIDGIFKKLDRGVTILNGVGGYSRAEKEILLCAIKNSKCPL